MLNVISHLRFLIQISRCEYITLSGHRSQKTKEEANVMGWIRTIEKRKSGTHKGVKEINIEERKQIVKKQ